MAGYIEEMIHPARKTEGIWIEKCGENIELLDELWRLIEMNKQVYAERIERLEQLCRDMYATIDSARGVYLEKDKYADRMEELGLLDGEQND